MFRKSCLLCFCAVLTSTSAVGADFHLDARVSVLTSLSVSEVPTEGPAHENTTLTMDGTQDQCLDVRWIDGAGETIDLQSSPGTDPAVGLFCLDGRGRGVVAPLPQDAAAVALVQITLN